MSHARYNLALAVVLGRDLDGVVCDTKATAQEAIAWLRANQVAPLTFFPLDTVRPKARAPPTPAPARPPLPGCAHPRCLPYFYGAATCKLTNRPLCVGRSCT